MTPEEGARYEETIRKAQESDPTKRGKRKINGAQKITETGRIQSHDEDGGALVMPPASPPTRPRKKRQTAKEKAAAEQALRDEAASRALEGLQGQVTALTQSIMLITSQQSSLPSSSQPILQAIPQPAVHETQQPETLGQLVPAIQHGQPGRAVPQGQPSRALPQSIERRGISRPPPRQSAAKEPVRRKKKLSAYEQRKADLEAAEKAGPSLAEQRKWHDRGYPTLNYNDRDFVEKLERRVTLTCDHLQGVIGKESSHFHKELFHKVGGRERINTIEGAFFQVDPGYYGPRGKNIICSVILDEMSNELRKKVDENPASLVAHQGVASYVLAVLVPEAAVRLIMEDMDLLEEDAAIAILKESIELGRRFHFEE